MASPARLHVPPQEIAIRADAIDPAKSVFLTANAGSGKTTILTSRVIRLLLEGADPARILCLTYTKAAAAEMQNRIFGTLSDWVRMDDATLRPKLEELTGRPASPRRLKAARELFARAVETPGGLKLQTIHAFSERLLHLFPFEANVPVRFSVMDETAQAELMERARRTSLAAALAAPESPLGEAFELLTSLLGDDDLDKLITASLPLLAAHPPGEVEPTGLRRLTATALDLSPDESLAAVNAQILSCALPPALWSRAIDAVAPLATGKVDLAFVEKLRQGQTCFDVSGLVDSLIDVLCNKEGQPRQTVVTKPILGQITWLDQAITSAKAEVAPLVNRRRALMTLERSVALMIVLDDILGRFRAAKSSRALVDFQDMIERTRALVVHPGASWVLRKLDGGIDHVLVDEAQDTTPQMWDIVRALTAEFFAGEGARSVRRTVFAVGDEKQSIYSFQGARPESFQQNRQAFAAAAEMAEAPFATSELQLSFRTVADVLNAVDRVFSTPDRFHGLSSDPVATVHTTARQGAPGLVELWPLEPAPVADPREAWEEVDADGRHSAPTRLAARIARHIRYLIDHERFADDGKRITPGDVMILVQRRDGFFEAVIRALKRENVPVAGADRVRLTGEQAVLDLIGAARVALLPDDDLMLANALKSPLIGLSDDDLMALAPQRSGSLYSALKASAVPAYCAAAETVDHWRALARQQTPYGFFTTLLAPMGGRRRLLERLGTDAADGIELFVQGVLARQTRGVPSLQAEVEAFDSLTTDIKRDQEQAGAAVRVLTVHGAKGLEARIVYLPDAQRMPNTTDAGKLLSVPAGEAGQAVLLWAGRKEDAPELILGRREAEKASRMDEYRRLFYVAMTRARDRLYIGGFSGKLKLNPESWYAMADAALGEAAVTAPATAGDGEVRQFRTVATPPAPPVDQTAEPRPAPDLPAWIARSAPVEMPALPPLRPSRLTEAADQIVAPEREAARQRGDLIHALLERIGDVPPPEQAAFAERYLLLRAPRLGQADRQRLSDAVMRLIRQPEVAPLFGPAAQAEVAIAGDVTLASGERRPVIGRIDRLLVTEAAIVVADFKTGRPPANGQARGAYLAQLALYRAVLRRIYPGRPVVALLIWTATASVMQVDPADLDTAFTLL